ncbi:para-aminobenzoate synthetase component 2 [Micrococcales bacterium KH10]|nr:para-aminobenzoate synthetase component 2 [Micrococcales bacterium KH10]
MSDSLPVTAAPHRTARQRAPHILVIDNHDSFVHTIVGYLEFLGARVSVLRNDERGIGAALTSSDGVLVSPGPGTPDTAGATLDVIGWCEDNARPMLGVCLGHQALAQYYGGRIGYAARIMHGRTSAISHNGLGLFNELPHPLTVTRYHSLVVESGSVPEILDVTAKTIAVPDDSTEVIMALRHRTLPLVSVQFHPEAVMTEGGHQLLNNWLATL